MLLLLHRNSVFPALDIVEKRNLYNIYVFDLSKQERLYILSGNNLVLNFTFSEASLFFTTAYVVTINKQSLKMICTRSYIISSQQ